MNTKKGFAPIAVILIIVAVLVAGGSMYYSYSKNEHRTIEENQANPCLVITSPAVNSTVSFPLTINGYIDLGSAFSGNCQKWGAFEGDAGSVHVKDVNGNVKSNAVTMKTVGDYYVGMQQWPITATIQGLTSSPITNQIALHFEGESPVSDQVSVPISKVLTPFTVTTWPSPQANQNAPTQNQPVCNANTTPWIKVISPNGGQTYTAGQQITVTWQKCNMSAGQISIDVTGYPTPSINQANLGFYTNNGSHSVTIPSNLPAGKYIIAVGTPPATFPSVHDESDASFTINNQAISTTLPNSVYITGTQWPPIVTTSTTAYSCTPSNGETLTVIQKVINGKTYCISSQIDHASGGLAGGDYIYTRANGGGTKVATFQLQWHYCDVHSLTTAQYNQCQTDQASVFSNLDAMVDSMM